MYRGKLSRFLASGIPFILLAAAGVGLLLHNIRKEAQQKLVDNQIFKIAKARQALELIDRARSYPSPTLPATGYAEAFSLIRTKGLQKTQTSSSDPETWTALGPQNVGGRTLAIAINPQNPSTIYAGSASGGLWRSFSAGAGDNAWHRVPTGFPVLAVSSVAIVPQDSSTIYIGTGEVYGSPETFPGVVGDRTTRGSWGIGVLKTGDGGITWHKSLDWSYDQRHGVQAVLLNPLRPETVWAATTGGMFVSYNAGDSWQQMHNVVMATALVINPADTSIMLAGCGGMGSPGHGLYRSMNAGASWQKVDLAPDGPVTFNGKIRLSISRSHPDVVYASIGKSSGSLFSGETTATWLCRSSDGGATWSVVSTLDYARIQGWYAHDVAVHPEDPDLVWTAGQPFIPYVSKDGGQNLVGAPNRGLWTPDPETVQRGLSSDWADYHAIVFDPTDPDVIYFANDGGVFRSDNGGQTVRNCNLGYQTTQFYNGFSNADDDSNFALGGLQDNGTVAFDGGLDWRRVFGGDGSWTAINQSNASTIYVSYQFLNMLRMEDRGTFPNSSAISPEMDASRTNFIAPFILSPADNQTLYAGSYRIYKSDDTGLSWMTTDEQGLDGNPMLSMAGSSQNADVVYAASSPAQVRAHVFRTRNGGDSWQDITGELPDRYLTDIVVNPSDDLDVFVVLGGFGTSHLFESKNGGDSWEDIGTGLPDIPGWSAAVDPEFPGHLFYGNDFGVFRSTDGGMMWQEFGPGLPEAVIAMDLAISKQNRRLRVATHGNGVYEIDLEQSPATSVSDSERLAPEAFVLQQNYPNPFNLETEIRFFVKEPGEINLTIYNERGQIVRRLVHAQQSAGWKTATWDGRDESGAFVSSAVYIYQMRAGGQLLSRKMVALK